MDYRLAPGEEGDGATLQVPLLALPTLTRAAVDAAVPGLAEPRVEALLRSLPKDARRGLIPIAATAAAFMDFMGAPSTNVQRLADWLKDPRGIPKRLIHFDADAVPAHLTAQLAVLEAISGHGPSQRAEPSPEQGLPSELGPIPGRSMNWPAAVIWESCAVAAPPRLARSSTATRAPCLPGSGAVSNWTSWAPSHGHRRGAGVRARVSGTRALSRRRAVALRVVARGGRADLRTGSHALARSMLERQARDLAKTIASDTPLLLAASPYLHGDALTGTLLHLAFRRACFQDAGPPTTRGAFEAAVDAGRERLYPALAELTASARSWFTEAREIRRLLDDPRARSHAAAAEESHAHLRRLFSADRMVDYFNGMAETVTTLHEGGRTPLAAPARPWHRAAGHSPRTQRMDCASHATRIARCGGKALDTATG